MAFLFGEKMKVYKTTKWKQKRERILRRDGYLCQESKRYGKTIAADTVHHIYQVEYYPELAFVDWNLISLSRQMHNAMHVRDSHELTELGKQWQERKKKDFEQWQNNISPPLET